ncbi:hypothetical protein [Kitasatospora sp. NPDC051914]|uniref:hypothetical protein n=1 Tax=Kitasatospora sp. NPDC051914 TaxID=3154945 RepID=UPI00341C95B0
MSSGERQGRQEQLDVLGDTVEKAGKHLRRLRDRTADPTATGGNADDFAFGTEESE